MFFLLLTYFIQTCLDRWMSASTFSSFHPYLLEFLDVNRYFSLFSSKLTQLLGCLPLLITILIQTCLKSWMSAVTFGCFHPIQFISLDENQLKLQLSSNHALILGCPPRLFAIFIQACLISWIFNNHSSHFHPKHTRKEEVLKVIILGF